MDRAGEPHGERDLSNRVRSDQYFISSIDLSVKNINGGVTKLIEQNFK